MNAHLAPRPATRFSPICPTVGTVLRRTTSVSPLQLADRILSLAQAADGAGHAAAAVQLLDVMYAVLDRPH